MSISIFIPPILLRFFKKLKTKKADTYTIGDYEIDIPENFALPEYQAQFKLYDKFLPVLAKNLPHEKRIIDVGANIGDTTISMLQFCTNDILCFEPSDLFSAYLNKNLQKLAPKDQERITVIKQLVGTGLLSGSLDHNSAGTASVKVSNLTKDITHIPLDNLIDDTTSVILLKVDTDGFDFDVIKSAEKILADSEPILFWENEILEDFQFSGFEELYDLLSSKGYKYVYIFDNYGNLMAEETNFETLKNINVYIYSMNKNGCTRTIYYTDILATTEKNHSIAKKAINDYKTNWINK